MPGKQTISQRLRQQVRERAEGKCEYCFLHDESVLLPHEVDHVLAEQHGGQTSLDNLAWSCYYCNHFKGTNISSVDVTTGRIVPLFNPRSQQWKRHFRLIGPRIEPLTASGRATESLLRFNTTTRIDERIALMAAGHYFVQK